MAAITLSVLRCPDQIVPGQRRASGGEVSLGRSADCDWPLDDPDRVLSKKHCVVEFYAGGWQLRDLSTNGTFVNHESEPVGRDQTRALLDGDRIRLGSYEIEVRIEQAAAAPAWGAGGGGFGNDAASPFGGVPASPFGDAPAGGGGGIGGGRLPLGEDFGAGLGGTMPDHAPATAGMMQPVVPVPAGGGLIPMDWNAEADFAAPPMPPPTVAIAASIPLSAAPPVMSPPVAAPQAAAVNPFLEAGDAPAPIVAPVTTPVVTTPVATTPAASLVALLEGAGVPPAMAARAAADPDATLKVAGEMLRAAIGGLRALLIARADIKREFRIEQTMIRAAGNNPVKFAATEEQALAAMLDQRDAGLASLQETVDDLTAHQVATLAATQAAARALLDRLAPGPIEAEDQGGGLLPGAKEKRLWEAYKRRHAQLAEQFEDDFDSAFGKAFARAYEQATGQRRR